MSATADFASYHGTVFGHAMHGMDRLNIPQKPAWWTEQQIQSIVTLDVVVNAFKDEDRTHLHRPLSFGAELTDDTYLEFILRRSKTMFLILAEVGIAGRIFNTIDAAYDDCDLPIPLDDIPKLMLSDKPDEKLNRKFYYRQYQFLLRHMQPGLHIDYEPQELVPINYVYQPAHDVSLNKWMRVRLPDVEPSGVLIRRRLTVANTEDEDALLDDFLADIEVAKSVQHDHIIPIQCSYTFKGAGYVLSPFTADHSLKHFLNTKGSHEFRNLAKRVRQKTLLQWLHCLAHALAYLHQSGLCHTAIRPSNIVIDTEHNIAFSDIGSLPSFQSDKTFDPFEAYNYGPPEAYPKDRETRNDPRGHRPSIKDTLLYRKRSNDSRSSSDSIPSLAPSLAPSQGSDSSSDQTDRVSRFSGSSSSSAEGIAPNAFQPGPPRKMNSLRTRTAPPPADPATEKSDVFSLGCIFLDLLSCLHKCKPTEMRKFIRTTLKGSTKLGMGGAFVDSSVHNNIPRVQKWMKKLDEKAFDQEDRGFRAVPHLLYLVNTMIAPSADLRPTAATVRDELYKILTTYGGFDQPDQTLHCSKHDPPRASLHRSTYSSGSSVGSPHSSGSYSNRSSSSS